MSTDEQGRFSADGLAPRVFDLQARKNGYGVARVWGLDPWDSPTVELILERAPAVHGYVLSETGGAVAGALVTVAPAGGADPEPNAELVRSALSDEQGAFELVGLPQSSFDLTAGAAGFRTAQWKDVTLGPDARSEGLELVLERGSALFGRVLDADGSAVAAGVHVQREDAGTDPERDIEAGFVRADSEGRFRLEGLEPGAYAVIARDDSGRSAERRVTLAADEAELELWLEGGVHVSGRVLDTTGRPVGGAEVRPRSPRCVAFYSQHAQRFPRALRLHAGWHGYLSLGGRQLAARIEHLGRGDSCGPSTGGRARSHFVRRCNPGRQGGRSVL